MAVAGTMVICRTRGGIPTPARGVRTRGGPGHLTMLQMERVAAALVFVIYVTVRPAYHDLIMLQHRQYDTFNN